MSLVMAGARVAAAEDTAMPIIIHEPCGHYTKGESFEVVARFQDESELFDPKIIYRTRPDAPWRNAPFTRKGDSNDFGATIKTTKVKNLIEYFIEVFDVQGNGPARMGSPDAPIRLRPSREPVTCAQVPAAVAPPPPTVSVPPPPPPTTIIATPTTPDSTPAVTKPLPTDNENACDRPSAPLYCSGWLWASVGGAVLVGGGVAMYFLVFKKEEAPPTYRDEVVLKVQGPDPTALRLRP